MLELDVEKPDIIATIVAKSYICVCMKQKGTGSRSFCREIKIPENWISLTSGCIKEQMLTPQEQGLLRFA